MLKILTVGEINRPILELKDFVIKLRWEKAGWGSSIYWRTGNFKGSLLEIKIYGGTGEISKLTLVIADRVVIAQEGNSNTLTEGKSPEPGIPICDISSWNLDDRYIDDPHDFLLSIGEDYITIDFETASQLSRQIVSGQVSFGVDRQNMLHTIKISDLSTEDVEYIKWKFREALNQVNK